MGNIQPNEKSKGKSPGKGKQFIRNLNRKSPGRDSKKHGRRKSDAKRDALDRDKFDKTPDSDNNETIEYTDTVESAFRTMGSECASVQSGVTVSRARSGSSATRDETPVDRSTSDSVLTEPLTPAVELNQCYYSAESSARDDLDSTLKEMPHDDAVSSLSPDDMEKEDKSDVFDDSSDRGEDEKVMGALFSGLRAAENRERVTHETQHEFREHRLKASPGQTSFTVSKHRRVELPPVSCDTTLILDNVIEREQYQRTASVGDVPMDSNVLRKVASITLDQHAETRVTRPKFVPEKLDFQIYQKFEGQMLLNWFVSSVSENKHLKYLLNSQDLKNIAIQYCTHLLAAGVLRQIPDKDAPTENVFKPNLMYYWAHMEPPASQPVTPGRLHMPSAWPPDRDSSTQSPSSLTYNIQTINQNNNEDINNLIETKIIIAQLKHKIEELEYQLEKQKLAAQIESINRNLDLEINQYNIFQPKIEMVSKEVQTIDDPSEPNNFINSTYKPVINRPEGDSLRTNVYNVAYSDVKKDKENIPETRSEKVENYCKLNKSRDNNINVEKRLSDTRHGEETQSLEKLPVDVDAASERNTNSFTTTCASLSDGSFCSTYASSEALQGRISNSLDSQPKEDNVESSNVKLAPSTHIMYSIVVKKHSNWPTTVESLNQQTEGRIKETQDGDSQVHKNDNVCSGKDTDVQKALHTESTENKFVTVLESGSSEKTFSKSIDSSSPVEVDTGKKTTFAKSAAGFSEKEALASSNQATGLGLSLVLDKSSQPSKLPSNVPLPPPMPEMGPPPPPMPGLGPPLPPPMPGICPPPPPMPEMGPPPPPMPVMGPPPPPMPGMGPSPSPMPVMGPTPPTMPGMGPTPPPMPGMGPTPPPMPGMGPPPPPMPGMGPPPPPMPGMGPPPPPMPGMGPPPPPMPGPGPPPPPMPGIGPPPPPLPGNGPPPPGVGLTTGGPPPPPMCGGPPPPPCPGMNPVPFPAPPVGGWAMQRATLRKTAVKPAAPMKPLYWTRILAVPPQSTGEEDVKTKPLWLEIDETELDNIDEFTDLFSRQVVKAPVKKKVEVKTKIQPTKILDSKRSQNVGILAQSLHVEFSEIENAIYNFDTSVVSLEALQQIYELRATEEELAMIKEHLRSKPDVPLDRPEVFLHDLSGIPHFAERVSCFMFQAEFEDAISTTMHKLDNLKHTCEFLTTSEPLKKLFAIILTLGNYMNGGNGQRGQADGFGLEILSKLKDVKSKQSNITLLHFIVRTYMRSCGGALSPACVLPVPEPGDVTRAAAIDFADVGSHLGALTNQLAACKEKTMRVIEDASIGPSNTEQPQSPTEGNKRLDVFKDKMTTFLNAAEEKLKSENENLEECRTKFIGTVKFYQYRPKSGKIEDCEPNEFFSLWTSFCSDFKDIYKKEEQLAIKERLKEAKKMQGERKPITQPKKEGGLKARLQKLSNTRKS